MSYNRCLSKDNHSCWLTWVSTQSENLTITKVVTCFFRIILYICQLKLISFWTMAIKFVTSYQFLRVLWRWSLDERSRWNSSQNITVAIFQKKVIQGKKISCSPSKNRAYRWGTGPFESMRGWTESTKRYTHSLNGNGIGQYFQEKKREPKKFD